MKRELERRRDEQAVEEEEEEMEEEERGGRKKNRWWQHFNEEKHAHFVHKLPSICQKRRMATEKNAYAIVLLRNKLFTKLSRNGLVSRSTPLDLIFKCDEEGWKPMAAKRGDCPIYGWFGQKERRSNWSREKLYVVGFRLETDVVAVFEDTDALFFSPNQQEIGSRPSDRQFTLEGVVAMARTFREHAQKHPQNERVQWAFQQLGSWLKEPPAKEDLSLWSLAPLRGVREVFPDFDIKKWPREAEDSGEVFFSQISAEERAQMKKEFIPRD
uniref:Uncharacterized protein n=1 Tax=Chromera velia CCMP2878 TaxID=1169474 RepID=A0A0G4GB09_9ALVE|eukprot:Cvel_21014.t1-p1 / transcript=Cvel_21014.t1 / gene=Cvel_21014 / organism=Chromera_velia_CCMP2878 / gene_product=hypothetical protein / transcript_product=hypothetical protein / location=Cvel_scaffold1936:34168-34977(+) / protein_length=270 / sequence_SO=supercontig / SO=protein_coding / is_pseudo=false